MVMDLTWFSEFIQGDDEDLSNVRGARGAKIGAKAARVVRVLRLVRILKLYKAVYDARQLKKKREELAKKEREGADPGMEIEDWDDMGVQENSKQGSGRESRVGKKLSELTIRRVICLVLVMMLSLPLLRIDQSQQFPTSATFGADVVKQAFSAMEGNESSHARQNYEKSLLQYIYYHNWFTGQASSCPFSDDDRVCPKTSDSQLFWVGFVSSSEARLAAKAPLAKVAPAAVKLMEDTITSVESSLDTAWIFNYGHMPKKIQNMLGSDWSVTCDIASTNSVRHGFSLLEEKFQEDNYKVDYAVVCPEDLRNAERRKYTPRLNLNDAELEDWHFAFYFDVRPYTRAEAVFNLLITLFVCLSLCTASVMFTNDANTLVLYPVENMIAKVTIIRSNPLMAMKVADEEFKQEEAAKAKKRMMSKSKFQVLWEMATCHPQGETAEIMETVILEKTIIKLGSLLALGFGEAGANIIEHNMNGVDSACVDAMVEGTRVDCIIGAARIRDFSTATEVLQAKVMTFVNQIAEIVHGVVDEFHGAANKNNGDTFLMIWRMRAANEDRVRKVADMSMLAFTRIMGAIHRSSILYSYRAHPGLQQRLGKNCRVNLSSGLHFGWAIEGAVGSEFKIDASYLSPNVSIAESVERATQIYGVSVLVAESVVSICSPAIAAKCRLIDRVVITGSVQPMNLYAIDLSFDKLMVEPPLGPQRWTSRDRFKVRQFLESEKESKMGEEVHMVDFFNSNSDIGSMRFVYTVEFMHVFNMGYQNYSQGEWQVAQLMLLRTKWMLGVEDGPSAALLKFMEHPYNFEAPKNW
eukprot:CAMPEP_0115062304 /NCGR_PEP_ID=MMETSP0227-20121206/8469_1 /TAXON_ID=89957 /ORGANISM="Polarella glacialis, Strain CCMP 1383" /LENGTH=807 /DNA_ID=CAMNT_0002447663 /DNA_START=134 /DNA_END=2554 /DNA_ORIENTATION=+